MSEDVFHTRARELFAQAEQEGWHLVTTNAVVYETHALLVNRAREGREAGLGFVEHIERGLCEIVRGSQDEAGRLAYRVGRILKKMYAAASSPVEGVVGR